jgi:hypothetical protein
MKIRSSRSIHITDLSYEQFQLAEFSKNVFQFVPQDKLSCNQCENTENDSIGQDSALSFLVKYKADQLSDPRKITSEGITGYFLPEDGTFDYRQEAGADSNFSSLKANHYNLYATTKQINDISLKVYSEARMDSRHSEKDVRDYLFSKYETTEWAALLRLKDKKGWKKFVKRILREAYESRYGEIMREDLKNAYALDPVKLLEELRRLKAYGCLEPKDLNEIQLVLGNSALH